MSERIRQTHSPKLLKGVLALLLGTLLLFLAGCRGVTEVDPVNTKSRKTQVFAGTGEGYVYLDNPTVLNGSFSSRANFDDVLSARFITDKAYLQSDCPFTLYTSSSFSTTDELDDECFLVLNDDDPLTSALFSENGSWAQPTYSDEFYQVNTFYHFNQIAERFLDALSFSHKSVHFDSTLEIPPATKYNFLDTQSYWLTQDGVTNTLQIYSKCYLESLNAFFSPALNILCFGWNDQDEDFFIVQDPSVIYHEAGHAMVKIMMNQRNIESGIDPLSASFYYSSLPYSSELGYLSYDEAGAINEGIADYFSYMMNGRFQIGEYAFRKLDIVPRPFNDDNSLHTADVSSNTGERLSYPHFLQYNPSFPEIKDEDIHNSGQIITHYLVALTEKMKDVCSFNTTDEDKIHETASNYTFLLINETLAELGDLTGKGSDYLSMYATNDANLEEAYFVNLNQYHSFEWQSVVNPVNYRKFARTMAKNIFYYMEQGLCPGLDKDTSETLLDEYGLLLFNSYDDKRVGFDINSMTQSLYLSFSGKTLQNLGNFTNTFSPTPFLTQVNVDNRRNSVLISKDFIEVDEDISYFLLDGQNEMKNIVASLSFEGENVATTEGIAGIEYNNDNVKISPGEVVGISINLFNNSNSEMGGVQLLANDWDHMRVMVPNDPLLQDGNTANDPTYTYVYSSTNQSGLSSGDISGYTATHEPCIIDEFPTASEGGVTDTTSTTPGSCSYITRTNYKVDTSELVSSTTYSKYDLDAPQPVCIVQYSDTNETKWVSQDFYRRYQLGLEDKDCLNNPSMSGADYNPNECLVRFLPGATQAIYGMIEPQKNFVDTLKSSSDESVQLKLSNIIIMEVNKWIMPGTTFSCRLRARHSNCSDCFDKDTGSEFTEMLDYEFAGSDPYKVINFSFTVID